MEIVILTIAFVINVALLVRLRRDDAFLRQYVANSPKAFLWRKAFGEERAAGIIRDILVPIGALVWLALIAWFALIAAGLVVA